LKTGNSKYSLRQLENNCARNNLLIMAMLLKMGCLIDAGMTRKEVNQYCEMKLNVRHHLFMC